MGNKQDEIASRSMTGFGRAEVVQDGIHLDSEVRSVNSRYLDIIFRIPKNYQQYESDLRSIVSSAVQRGRIEITINRRAKSLATNVKSDSSLAEEYYKLGEDFFSRLGLWTPQLQADFALQVFLRREILDRDEVETEQEFEKELLLRVVRDAVSNLIEMRTTEGKALSVAIHSHFKAVEGLKKDIVHIHKKSDESIKERLHQKIEKIYSASGRDRSEIEEQRLALEIAIIIDKADIQEELVRIDSHLDQAKRIMGEYPHGRKIEFLLQEIGREFNTIASKSQTSEINQKVVDAKSQLEKIKEQILNVE